MDEPRHPDLPASHASASHLEEPRSEFAELVDYRLVETRENYARVELTLEKKHLNRNHAVHGGVLATLIDVAGGRCGTYCPVAGNLRKSVTVSLTTAFLRQARHGKLIAEGRRLEAGTRLFTAMIEVHDEAGRIVGSGQGTYKYLRGSEKVEGVPASPKDRSPRSRPR